MSNVWKMIQEKKRNSKTHAKKAQAYFCSKSKISKFQTSFTKFNSIIYVMGFSNRAQRFAGSNYTDVDSPLKKHTKSCIKCKTCHNIFETLKEVRKHRKKCLEKRLL